MTLQEHYDEKYNEGHTEGLKQGMEQGLAQGMEQGLAQGMEQGLNREKEKMINRLLGKGKKPEEITELLGYSQQEIEDVRCRGAQKAGMSLEQFQAAMAETQL